MHLTVPLFLASSIASMLTMMPSIPTAWGPSSYIPSSLSSLEPIPTSWESMHCFKQCHSLHFLVHIPASQAGQHEPIPCSYFAWVPLPGYRLALPPYSGLTGRPSSCSSCHYVANLPCYRMAFTCTSLKLGASYPHSFVVGPLTSSRRNTNTLSYCCNSRHSSGGRGHATAIATQWHMI